VTRPQWRVKPYTSHNEPAYRHTKSGAVDVAWRMARQIRLHLPRLRISHRVEMCPLPQLDRNQREAANHAFIERAYARRTLTCHYDGLHAQPGQREASTT